MIVTLRELAPEDAGALLSLQHRLDQETAYMMLAPGERKSEIQQVEEMIASFAKADTSILIGAEAGGELAGYLSVRGGSFSRNKHSAYIVIGILKQYQGMGIGNGLFIEMDRWAKASGIVRLELTVMIHNERAVALYTRQGFDIEGVKKKSLLVNGEWVDEYYMSKLFTPALI
ncbi:GNAT family N-acetyltransferase [Paenibacillus sp. MMS20-IR301]|uniref:GNAT family N-acetyltransferase n=1 Tax=Paenibacillus sp. MMS20-IR301 TaxID=2895946 RepID=UPI0028E3D898|nr:GNAT family N-acetyltransferase [Paenibacillus sp. MMS20-IR301]WNS45110.1 GNAT family N-acetyltransferase [Paenibacillus sp. MMS20-IR301]